MLRHIENGLTRRICLSLLTGVSALTIAGAAQAQEVADQSGSLEEIVVTAQRRSESLQSVPIQVAAFSAAKIEDAGIKNTRDFVALIPNVTLDESLTYLNSYITVRGVSEIDNADSPVAVVVDGVPQSNQKQLQMNLFDVERIEVLKGPQGGLYGRNAIGGAINIITKAPSAELRENQKDQDSLPPYDILDGVLERLVEREEPVAKIVEAGFDRDTVLRVDRMLNLAEYKRRQAAPGVKVTLRNFGRDRRYPITNRFRDPGTPVPKPDATLVSGTPAKSEAFDF